MPSSKPYFFVFPREQLNVMFGCMVGKTFNEKDGRRYALSTSLLRLHPLLLQSLIHGRYWFKSYICWVIIRINRFSHLWCLLPLLSSVTLVDLAHVL